MINLIIAGGRDLIITPKEIDEQLGSRIIDCVFSGGASGIDTCGEVWAKIHNIPVRRYLANWSKYGKYAGPKRNAQMAMEAHILLLAWDGKSPGSANMLKCATTAGLESLQFFL